MRTRSFAVVFIASLAAACRTDEPAPQQAATASPAPQAAVAAPSPAVPVPTATAAPAATSSTPATAGAAIASADGEQPGVTLAVTEFKRATGETATLKFTIVNNGSEPFDFGYLLGDPSHGGHDHGSVGGVHLLDPVNKKKYFVVRDSDGKCVCSRELRKIEAGKSMNLWAKFPAPDVQRVTIVVPHFMPMDDAPLS